MKKKTILLGLMALLALPLTSCDYILRFFGDSDNSSPWVIPIGNTSSSISSSKEPISDVSTPPAGDLTAHSASCNYSDFVDNSVYPLSCTPSKGTAHLLIIPVWFTDSTTFITSEKKETVRSDIEKAYFQIPGHPGLCRSGYTAEPPDRISNRFV